MYQIVEQTKEEKVVMYMKCTKKQLIEMLIESNRMLDIMIKRNEYHKTISENSFEDYKYNTICARATIYPNKTYEEVEEIIEKQRDNWSKH